MAFQSTLVGALVGLLVLAPIGVPRASAASEKGEKEQKVSLDQLPAAAQQTIQKESAGGQLKEITKETERGHSYYEAKIVKNGKESNIHVSDNGKVLKREGHEKD